MNNKQDLIFKIKELQVFGNDYPTPAGSCIRDYIHVVDLAKAHINALKKLAENPGTIIHSLGTGTGYSVLEMIKPIKRHSVEIR